MCVCSGCDASLFDQTLKSVGAAINAAGDSDLDGVVVCDVQEQVGNLSQNPADRGTDVKTLGASPRAGYIRCESGAIKHFQHQLFDVVAGQTGALLLEHDRVASVPTDVFVNAVLVTQPHLVERHIGSASHGSAS